MAGEDPGASTIAVILDAIQRAWSAVTGSIKAVMGGVVDIVKTSMFFRWRKQMMQNSGGKLKHGYQSLKKLRRHEDRGATLKSIEIGMWEDAKLFKKELKRAGIDFALTHDEDGVYTLHYKSTNEADVLHAQYSILEQRYGGEPSAEQDHDPASRDGREDERNNDQAPQNDQIDEPRYDDLIPQDAHEQDRQEREQQERERQEREQQQREQKTHSDEEQTTPARTEPTERTTPRVQKAPSVADPVRAEANHSNSGLSRTAISNEPLSELKRQARERARAKNLARAQSRDRSQDRGMSHRTARVRAREFDPGH